MTGAEVRWLDYADSGMHGWVENDAEGSFHAASTDEAGGRLAAILDEVGSDNLFLQYDIYHMQRMEGEPRRGRPGRHRRL